MAFVDAVKSIFDGWTVLRLAVEHGFGGGESIAKAAWLVAAVDQWFSENDDLDPYEVEEFLTDVLDTEFNTVADDGSLKQISQVLCQCYRLLAVGNTVELEKCLSMLPNTSAANQSMQQPDQCADDDDGDEEMDTGESESCAQCDQGDSADGQPSASQSSLPVQQNQRNTSGSINASTEEDNKQDGWTMVKKGKKR